MSNKKNQRRSGRNVKVPMKLNDHVIGNLNSRRTDNVSEVTEKEARVTGIGESIESGVKSMGKDEIVHGELQVDKEVNATVSNSQTPTVNNIVDSVIVDIDSNSGDKLVNTVNDTNKSVNSMLNGDDAHANRVEKNVNAIFYAKMVTKDEVPTKLTFVPTVTTELGSEVVVFDELLVLKGSEKWNLTVCGQFVGYSMNPNELRYNIRRMWSKFGVQDIVYNNGHFLFKFRNKVGMDSVIEKGPWMVNNKTLFVQKWSPEMNMEKIQPRKLPVWVKMINIPLEARSVDGISALASSVGIPILMDNMTATICHKGMGNLGYARVLVEISAEKSLKESIEIQYRDKENNVKGSKTVKVVYGWKPPVCEHCKVFGHDFLNCNARPKSADEIEKENNDKAKEGMESHNGKKFEDKNEVGMQRRRFNNRYQANPYKYAATQKNDSMNKGQAKDGFKNTNMGFKRQEYKRKQNGNSNVLNEKGQSSNNENEAGVKSTNKYDMLNGLGNENEELDKSKVDEELNGDIEDVLEGTSGGAKVLSADEVSDGTRSISEEYNVEFPPIPTSHNQYVALIEEYKRGPDVSLLWQKEQTLVEKLVNNKKIPTIEETKIWPLRMFEIYKEGWEAKWKTECPFIGNFQE